MVSQFYPPIVGGQERHVRNLAHGLVDRGHHVEVVTIATDGPPETTLDGDVPLHRIRTTAQRLPLYAESERPHATPIIDPRFRNAISRLLTDGKFDIVHAHDWSVGSAIGPARRAGVPVVLTQHEYSHVCATKRLIRGGDHVCPGPTPIACVRCASAWYGPVVGTGVALTNALAHRTRTRRVDAFVPVSSFVATKLGYLDEVPTRSSRISIPDDLVVDEPVPNLTGRSSSPDY